MMEETADESRRDSRLQAAAQPIHSFGKLEPLERWRRVFIFLG